MTTVSTSSERIFARAIAPATATAPRLGAGTSLRLPPNVPIAVRTGSAKTTERCDAMAKSPGAKSVQRPSRATHAYSYPARIILGIRHRSDVLHQHRCICAQIGAHAYLSSIGFPEFLWDRIEVIIVV